MTAARCAFLIDRLGGITSCSVATTRSTWAARRRSTRLRKLGLGAGHGASHHRGSLARLLGVGSGLRFDPDPGWRPGADGIAPVIVGCYAGRPGVDAPRHLLRYDPGRVVQTWALRQERDRWATVETRYEHIVLDEAECR